MNFALTLLGFLFAICAVASQSSECNPSCSIQSGSGTGCTSTQDLQTMCSRLSLLCDSSTPVSIGDMVGVCVRQNLMNSDQAKALTNADILVSNSALSKAGSSQYESIANVAIKALKSLNIESSLVGDNQYPIIVNLALGMAGNWFSNNDPNSGTEYCQAGENTDIISIMTNFMTGLGFNNKDSKSASNCFINAVVGVDPDLPSTLTQIVPSLGINDNISIVVANINAAITAVLRKGTSTSDAACSNAGDSLSLLNTIAAALQGSEKNQNDVLGLATGVLHGMVKEQLSAADLVKAETNTAVKL